MTRTPDAPPRKFRRRAEARPDEVLDAALDLFISRGFAATRVEDIATSAGISKGAVYLYFPSKEAILEALVRRAIVPVAENASALALAGAGNPADVLRTIVGLVAGRLAESRNAAIPRLLIGEAGKFPELARMYRAEVIDRALPAIRGLLLRGIEEGVFRPVDPDLAVRNIIGPVLANVIMTEVFEFPMPDARAFAESHLDILMNGLLAGGEAR